MNYFNNVLLMMSSERHFCYHINNCQSRSVVFPFLPGIVFTRIEDDVGTFTMNAHATFNHNKNETQN